MERGVSVRSTIPKPDDRAEWLAARAPYIGASEAAALIGEHPFLSAGELAVEKIAGRSVRAETSAMKRGRHLEAAVADWFSEEHDVAMIEPDELYVIDGVFIATLDRRIVGSEGAVEIKTTSRHVDELERYWYWQAQCQMLCAGLEFVEVVVLDASMDLQCFHVEPNLKDHERLLEAGRRFLEHVARREVPPDIDLTYRAASALHREATDTSTELDDETWRWCRALRVISERIKGLQLEESQLKGMIGHHLGSAAEGRHDGRVVVTWRQVTRNDLDVRRLRAEHPELARDFSSPTRYRQLRLVDRKEKS